MHARDLEAMRETIVGSPIERELLFAPTGHGQQQSVVSRRKL
jgi:hypothetical protein